MSNLIYINSLGRDNIFEEKLFFKLKEGGFNPWLKRYSLKIGQNKANGIKKAIQRCSCFVTCFSLSDNIHRSNIYQELRLGLKELELRPPDIIFFIPVLIEECEIPNIRIGDFSIRDFQPLKVYGPNGLNTLVSSISKIEYFSENINYDNTDTGSFSDQVKKLIGDNKTEAALDILMNRKDNLDMYNSSLLLSCQLTRLKEENLVNLISYEDYNIRKNRIDHSIINLYSFIQKILILE